MARTDLEAILLNIKSDCCHPPEPEKIQIQTFKQVVKARAISESTPIPQIYGEEAARIDLSTLSIAALPSQKELSQKKKTLATQHRIDTLYIRYDNGDINANELLDGLSYVVAKY
ncbi:unnamed protein product [Rotaria sp. Silwood1]|nr:unnamed protein product [Rotaria sp. Silwood1]